MHCLRVAIQPAASILSSVDHTLPADMCRWLPVATITTLCFRLQGPVLKAMQVPTTLSCTVYSSVLVATSILCLQLS